MKVITVATEHNGYIYALEQSVQRFGYELIILGMNMKWKGFGWKLNMILNFIDKLPKKEVFIVVDAYDVIFLRPSVDVLDTFKKMNVKFLCGAVRQEDGIIGILQEKEFGKVFTSDTPYNSLCAGTWMTTVEYALYLFENIDIKNDIDDQKLLTDLFYEGKDITPDVHFNIFATLFPNIYTRQIKKDDDIKIKNGMLFSGVTKTYPFVLHGVANANLQPLLIKLCFENIEDLTPFSYHISKTLYHLKTVVKHSDEIRNVLYLILFVIICIVFFSFTFHNKTKIVYI